jgi:hypothetical protein
MSTSEKNAIWGLIVTNPAFIINGHVDGEVDLGKFLGFRSGMLGEQLGGGI